MNANIIKNAFAFLLVISAGVVSAAQGDVFTWTGAEDNYWTNKNNWAEGKIPNGMSKAIFDPGEGKTIYINMRNRGWGTTSTWPNVYEFKSGNIYFSTYIRYTGSGNTSPGVFYVAEGATAVVSNELFTASGKACMKKTGKGDLICVGKFAINAAIPQVTVEEGLFRYIQGKDGTFGKVERVTIKSGATFYPSGGGATLGEGNLVIAVEKGGIFKASCGGFSYPNTIDHLEGEGTVEQGGSYDYGLKIKGTTAGQAFSGNFSGNVQVQFMPSVNPVIIGGTDTLSTLNLCVLSTNVCFLPSEKPYRISKAWMKNPGVYKALDINGKPVVIKVGQSVNIAVDGMEFAFDKMYTPEYYGFYWSDDNCGIAITKGLYCATPSVLSNIDAPRMLPAPKGMVMRIGQVNSSITMRDGELWLKSKDGECQMPKVFDLFGGDLAFYGANANGVCKDATPLSPAVLNLRGGRVLVDMHGDYCYSTMLFANTNAFRVVVHDKPAVFKAVNHTAAVGPDRTIDIARPIESGVEEGKDGGLTLEGAPVFKFRYPVLLNGPFTALDGEILLDNRADTDTTAAFFGSGDVNFGNVEFRFPDNPASSKTVKFATDEGASFCVKGASQFTFKKSSSALSQNVEIGGDLVRTRGGVLFLSEHGCAGGFQSTFKVDKGVELNEALLTKMPILFRDPLALKHRFATCDKDGRIVPLTDVATSLDDADGKKAVVLSSAAELSADEEKSVAALMIDDVKLELNAGSKINVGVGDDPAFVVWNKTYTSGKLPKGSGTIDFGAREGVVVIDSRNNADYVTLPIPFTLAGSGGITFISAPEKAYKYLKLTGANTYSGPTTINSIRVEPCTSSAFGLGEVHVGGGERAGGRIYFGTPVTLPNDFFVSGRGINKSAYSDTSGAFVFATNATLTGSVTLEGETRMTLIDGARGTISGTVKGVGRLSLYPGDGTLVLEGDNTYTGGTEVVGASLAVTRTGSLGSGDVVLDGGILVFENASAMSLTNTVSGIGTIALKGSAPVAFDGNLSNLEASLDLCGTWQTFTEMPPFGKIVNSHSGKATFALASNLGTVSWPDYAFEGKVSLAIGEGTVLDLGGREIEVFRLEPGAASKIVNGTVKQIKPMVGMRVIFR